MEDRKITLFIGNEEKEMNILFTFHHDQRNADYVLIYDENSPEDVMLFQYFDDQTMEAVEDEEILAEAQELLDTFESEEFENSAE